MAKKSKLGRNKLKCKQYAAADTARKNKTRRAKRLTRELAKAKAARVTRVAKKVQAAHAATLERLADS